MKLWIVNHGAKRPCLKVHVRSRKGRIGDAFILAEWNARPVIKGESYIVPMQPREGPWPNTDPLVIGDHFFYDYCKKGKKSTLSNLTEPNTLEPSDMILFGGMREGRVVLDTILVVGEWRTWPRETPALPNWTGLGMIAKRTHFHSAAHTGQHPEVHSSRPVAGRSYRGRPFGNSGERYSWVPAFDSSHESLMLGESSEAVCRLASIFPKPLVDHFKGGFPVVSVNEQDADALFHELVAACESQGGYVGVRVSCCHLAEMEEGSDEDEPEGRVRTGLF